MFLLFATSSSKRMPVIDIGLGLKQFGARWSSCWRMAALKAFTTSWGNIAGAIHAASAESGRG